MEEGPRSSCPTTSSASSSASRREFRFFAAATRTDDSAGTLIDADATAWSSSSRSRSWSRPTASAGRRSSCRCALEAHVTEVGTLELWCVARDGRGRWKLEYSVRERD